MQPWHADCAHLGDLPPIVVGARLRVCVVRVEPHQPPRPEVVHCACFGPCAHRVTATVQARMLDSIAQSLRSYTLMNGVCGLRKVWTDVTA